jgi:hypothetical protein
MASTPIEPLTVIQRLSVLRDELDPVLGELVTLSQACRTETDTQLRELHEQLKRAIYHLELTLDDLTPPHDQQQQPLSSPTSD